MLSLSAHKLFSIWEEGRNSLPCRQALLLLSAASDDETADDIASLSIGSRDARLLALRELTFGPELRCLVDCPACGEKLEFDITAADIRLPVSGSAESALLFELDGYAVDFRLPDSRDLIAADGSADVELFQATVLERCINSIRYRGEEAAFSCLPPGVIQALTAQIESADPQADVQLALVCEICNHRWQVIFDIVSYFWSEIHAWAVRMIRDVHLLASAYGWREVDILNMSAFRRNLYLELIGS